MYHNWRQDDYRGDPLSWSIPAVMHYASHADDLPQVAGEPPPDVSGVPRTECRDVPDEAYFDGRIANAAVEALRELQSQPFFLAVGFWKPHLPFNAPQSYWDLYQRSSVTPPANPGRPAGAPEIAFHDSRELLRGFPHGLTDSDVLAVRHGYYAGISYVDAQIGKVLEELDRLGLRDSTIVVFWSDHGFHLGEHDLWCKTSNFELDARVPLIISVPGQTSAGQRTRALVELLDLYPTLADLCGLTTPATLEGRSLRPVIEDPNSTVKQAAFTQHPRPAYGPERSDPDVMGYSVRSDRYRYTEWRDVKTGEVRARELYDHEVDPQETVNRADDPALADVVRQQAALMREFD